MLTFSQLAACVVRNMQAVCIIPDQGFYCYHKPAHGNQPACWLPLIIDQGFHEIQFHPQTRGLVLNFRKHPDEWWVSSGLSHRTRGLSDTRPRYTYQFVTGYQPIPQATTSRDHDSLYLRRLIRRALCNLSMDEGPLHLYPPADPAVLSHPTDPNWLIHARVIEGAAA